MGLRASRGHSAGSMALESAYAQRGAREASMWKEFKEFALRGNVVDVAVGIIIGAAFANLFVLLKQGAPGAPYASLADAQAAGAVTINYGVFLNAVISFLAVVLVMFFLIRMMNRMRREEEAPAEPTTKECPFCLSTIPIKATRCAFCTSELGEAA
jgi:large conductance mechanosensitive channel